MNIVSVVTFLTFHIIGLINATWYKGCYVGEIENSLVVDEINSYNIVNCAKYCHHKKYKFIGVKKGSKCVCITDSNTYNRLTTYDEACNKKCFGEGGEIKLPCGGEGLTWSIYQSSGPYIQHLNSTVPGKWIITGEPVILDAYIYLASYTNISTKSSKNQWLKTVNVTWIIGNETFHTNSTEYTSWIRSRFLYTFTKPGFHTYEIIARNHISSSTTTANLTVLKPAPKDLQISLISPKDHIPSCIPLEHGSKPPGPLLTVFCGETVRLEISVAVGVDLTFTIKYGDTEIVVTETPDVIEKQCDGNCTALVKEHIFEKSGRFLLQAIVSNQYGEESKNITVVVMEPLLEEAFFVLEEKSSIFEKGTPIRFLVSLETTIRPSTVMQINFGNEDLQEVSLGEHHWNNETEEDGYHLDYLGLVASYGEGCNLTIEFQYQYNQQGVFMPSIMFDNQTESLTMLDENIIILNRLVGLRIFSSKITSINTSTEFKLIFEKSSFNISVLWTFAASTGDIIDQIRSNSLNFHYTFTRAGRYMIHVNVSNSISKVYSSVDILVQVPVNEIDVSCKPEQYLVNGSYISCQAGITHGTQASFVWSFNDPYGLTFVDNFDLTSFSQHTFSQPGSFQIEITVYNDVSHRTKIYPLTIGVESILHQVMLIPQSPTILGESTHFRAGTHDMTPNAENIQFEFDFGSGRKSFEGERGGGEFEMNGRFDEAGIYEVWVFASNNVSEVSTSVIVYVEKPVEHGIGRVLLPAVIHLDSIFIITCQEDICQRDDVIYEYQFDDKEEVIVSRSPVIFHKYTSPNHHTLNYTISNQVGSVAGQFEFEIDKSLLAPKAIHRAIVSVEQEVDFRIIGIEDWKSITINYNDGTEDIHHHPIDSWNHTFYATGIFHLAVSIYGQKGNRTSIKSYISVEQPITDLKIVGPSAVGIKRLYHDEEWRGVSGSGSHIVYTWSLDDITYNATTVNRFFKSFEYPGRQMLTVWARNDVSEAKASMKINVQYPVLDVYISTSSSIAGLLTNFTLHIFGGRNFLIHYDFGDGSRGVLTSDSNQLKVTILYSGNGREMLPTYTVAFSQYYTIEGEYLAKFNVSNMVSTVAAEKMIHVEEPITGIRLFNLSRRVVPLSNPDVTVKATVDTGKDLKFKWDFGDNFDEFTNVSSSGKTSIATHRYNLAEDYEVKVIVSNPRYPHTIVKVLPMRYLVVEDIENIIFRHVPVNGKNKNGASLNDYGGMTTTDEVIFEARVEKGSHMMFIFDFGDGETETKYLEFILDPMMQLITAKHRYQNEGVYEIKLTVVNPLGNVTVLLEQPFYVQIPPDGIELFGSLCILPRQDLHLTLGVATGTNITINWKMGDETEFIDHGKSVKHQYQTTGTKFLEVIVYNRVHKIKLPREVTVVDEIHGATLKVPSGVVIAGEKYTYNVTPRPKIDGIVQYYEWDSNSTLPRGSEITKDPVNRFALPSGKHMLTVTATNCLSEAISKPVNIHAVAQLVELSIMAGENKLVGKPVKFQAKFWDGDYLNFTWDFGDGHQIFLVGQVNVNHTYKQIGEYTVRLIAANPISSMATHYQVFILDQVCNPPDISIVKPSRHLDKLTFIKSEVLYIEANVKVRECELSSVVLYYWKIIDMSTDRPVLPRYPDDPVFRSSSLILPSHSLHYGNYTVNLEVKMNGTIVYSMSKTKLEVIPSPLKVTIDGGKYRKFNHKDILVLNGSQSRDLDQQSNLSYKWSCVVLSSKKQCFENSTWPPNIPKDVALVMMPIRLLRKDKSDFMFNLTVSTASGRNASTEQVIKILKVNQVLSLKIRCKQCIGDLVNPSTQVSFETSCTGCLPTQTQYKWEVKLVLGEQHPQSAVHDFGQCVQPDGSSYDLTFLSQKLGTTKEPKKTTSQRISQIVTTSLPMFGPWMMNEGQGGRGSYGRGGMLESRMTEGQRPQTIPETFRGAKLNEGLPFHVRSQLRNLPRHHDTNDILTIPREGSPGESGSSQGRIIGSGTSVHNPIEQPGLGRQFEDKPGHRTSKDEKSDRVLGRPTPRNETKHVFSQDSTTVRLLPQQTKTGLNKQSLVIKADVFMQGRTYVVKVTAHSRDNITGVAMMYFKVNQSPQKGLCEVSSTHDGVELETNFKVFCREWKDEHMPLKFEVSYNLYKEDMKKLLYRGLSHEINFKLPAGNITDDNKVYLYIGILDGIQARTSVCPIPIHVQPRDFTNNNSSYDELFYRHNVEIEKSVQQGDRRTACVLIDYLAKQLNGFTEQVETKTDLYLQQRQDTRWYLLNLLSDFPKRDEVEILQVAQSLVSTTAVASELTETSLLKALEVLQSLYEETEALNTNLITGFPDLLTLAVRAVSNIMQAVLQSPLSLNNKGLKMVTGEALRVVDSLVKLELQHHSIGEEPIKRMAEFVSVIATHFLTGQKQKINIEDASFLIPTKIPKVTAAANDTNSCYQAHMTTFKQNPFGYNEKDSSKIQSQVVSLDIYSCQGRKQVIQDLNDDNQVEIWIPRNNKESDSSSEHLLKRDVMNVHQFNVTKDNLHLSLFITLDLNPIENGHPFPLALLIGQHSAPQPDMFYYKEEFDQSVNTIKVFLPTGSFNATGMYYIGVVDGTYNAGRRRPGELLERQYIFTIWWGQCFYWNSKQWSSHGCTITSHSDIDRSHCRCNHLTAFGGHFDLIPNDLSFTDVDDFFCLNENPVVVILIGVILMVYTWLMVICYKTDVKDARKRGLINLKDNRPTDKHNYEITVETGYRQGSGTTAKISFILHGEEGMSETRELISDDDRILFEQNSRDVFIMSLPDTLGRLWKVQLWHNNHGPSPSWYLSRVIIKDLCNGKMSYFLCEKWFAVEEDDGKVEREIMVLDSNLGFSRVFWAKGTQYVADFHLWLSPYTCPSFSRFTRIERLTCCLTVLLSYLCLNAVWYQSKEEYRGEFGLLDLSLRNITVGVIISCIVLPLNLFLAFLFRRSKKSYPCPEPDKIYPSGKQSGEQISETDEGQIQPVMTYSILDQSILNWQGIQDWAQKQWRKRHGSDHSNVVSVKSLPHHQNQQLEADSEQDPNLPTLGLTSGTIHLSRTIDHLQAQESPPRSPGQLSSSPQSSPPSPYHPHPPPYNWSLSQGPLCGPRYLPSCQQKAIPLNCRNMSSNCHDLPVLHVPVLQNVKRGYETDQASSGFVDATSQSQATADRTRIKLYSETSSSGRQSSTEYVDNGRKWRLFLPFWCRYTAWFLCIAIILSCIVITILYGFRFGYNKSMQWLQSLYFTFMICVFITQPLLILAVVLYTAVCYRNDPAILNHHDDGYYGNRFDPRKKSEESHTESYDPREELKKGVAERQRSRYLRFARPPHEKTLIEARKKTIQEKRAFDLLRCSVVQILLVLCVSLMAYGKDLQNAYQLNTAISKIFANSGNLSFSSLESIPEFYSWCQTTLLDNLYEIKATKSSAKERNGLWNSILIGSANLRQLRVKEEPCLSEFAFPIRSIPDNPKCRYSYTQQYKSVSAYGPNSCWSWSPSRGGLTLWGEYGFYDDSGFVVELNDSKEIGVKNIKELQDMKWIDVQTRAIVIEFTIYYIPDNLFSCVSFLVETPQSGGLFTKSLISSTYLFRYVTTRDNFILAAELLFFAISLYKLQYELISMVIQKKKYFKSFWSIIELLLCMISMGYMGCYVYRYILVSDMVEHLRNTYYQQFVDITFIACWNEILRALIGTILFLICIKCVRLLNRNSWCVKAANFYKHSQKELYQFMILFAVLIMAFSSAGVALFGTAFDGVKGMWSSIFTMVMALTGVYPEPDINQSEWSHLFILSFIIFATGLLSTYILAVISSKIKREKLKDPLQMTSRKCICFLWDKFRSKIGVNDVDNPSQPENILPAEFIMAEIEYQVDELLFRMNALSGSSSLPDKPRLYFTDSDTTHNIGDDGISTGGSEPGDVDTRLGQRVQRIEDKLYANEPYLAQLLKLESVGTDILSQEKEKQIRSHLELEIFRQLQLQRQEGDVVDGGLLSTTTEHSGHRTEQSLNTSTCESANGLLQDKNRIPWDSTGLANLLKLGEALPKSSSSSPDSIHEKNQQNYSDQIRKCIQAALLEAKIPKQSSSSESPQSSESDKTQTRTDSSSGQSSNTGSLTKPSSHSSDSVKNSKRKHGDQHFPLLSDSVIQTRPKPPSSASVVPKMKPTIPPKPNVKKKMSHLKLPIGSPKHRQCQLAPTGLMEGSGTHIESSSGSEQDVVHSLKRTSGKRTLRKTRSQGRGKGHLLELETEVFGEEEEAEIDDET